jgi:hypothetical protein
MDRGVVLLPRRTGRRTVEELNASISRVIVERQYLRGNGERKTALEQNRLELVRLQWELSYGLIERHTPTRVARQAA